MVGPFKVFIEFDSSVPVSYRKNERMKALSGLYWPRIDIDNCAKSVLDVLTDAKLWNDDSEVVFLSAVKKYAEKDEIRVVIAHA